MAVITGQAIPFAYEWFDLTTQNGKTARALKVVFSATAGSTPDSINVTNESVGLEGGAQSVFIDNSGESVIVTMTIGDLKQQIVCNGFSQLYVPVLGSPTMLNVSVIPQTGSCVVPIYFINAPMGVALIWT